MAMETSSHHDFLGETTHAQPPNLYRLPSPLCQAAVPCWRVHVFLLLVQWPCALLKSMHVLLKSLFMVKSSTPFFHGELFMLHYFHGFFIVFSLLNSPTNSLRPHLPSFRHGARPKRMASAVISSVRSLQLTAQDCHGEYTHSWRIYIYICYIRVCMYVCMYVYIYICMGYI